MAKIWVEVCLISARGLRRTSFWRLQWFAVGWIDPNSKYCTKVDSYGNANPVWKTKFAFMVDESKMNLQDLTLQVEVYCRDPLFLREKLHGSATVILKEYLARHDKNSEGSSQDNVEVGSYQLRKKNSSKPKGFVDISIRVSEEKDEPNSYPGDEGGFLLMPRSKNINLAVDNSSGKTYPSQMSLGTSHQPENQFQREVPYSQPVPFPQNHYTPYVGGPSYLSAAGPSYQPPRTPPPPPPPANAGYLPTSLPTGNLASSYINMPSSVAGPARRPPGYGVGSVGAGALAAGAVIFGADYMSGFDYPSSLQDPTLAISVDPPF